MALRIPIKAARDIAKKYRYDQLIILGIDVAKNRQHVTTFGKSTVDADQAAQGGNYIKQQLLGWPANECLAEPTRVRKLLERIKELERKIEGKNNGTESESAEADKGREGEKGRTSNTERPTSNIE